MIFGIADGAAKKTRLTKPRVAPEKPEFLRRPGLTSFKKVRFVRRRNMLLQNWQGFTHIDDPIKGSIPQSAFAGHLESTAHKARRTLAKRTIQDVRLSAYWLWK